MAKSKYTEKLNQGIPFLHNLHDGEIGRLGRASRDDQRAILETWEDLAGSERLVRDSHQGRYLFELIQNANDAIADEDAIDFGLKRTIHRIRLELSKDSLLAANFGLPFREENVRALRRLHKTTKKVGVKQDEGGKISRSKRIGHKGIGFKSVLEITDRPEVYSDIFAFGFDVDEFRKEVARIIENADQWKLPTFRVPYPRYINQLSPQERERIERLFDEGFVTIIRLPIKHQGLFEEISNRIEQDVQAELLLFMSAISRLEVSFPDGHEKAYERKIGSVGETGIEMVSLEQHIDGNTTEVSRWLTLRETLNIPDRKLVADLGEAWEEVDALGFTIAFPIKQADSFGDAKRKQPGCLASEPFHVYYPTHECSGLGYKIHGDFYVGDNRKFIPTDKPINKWLIDEICTFITGKGLENLKKQWPYDAELVYRLIPVEEPEGDFAQAFMETYLEKLRITPFVPIPGRNYKSPEAVRLPPREIDRDEFNAVFPPARIRGEDKWAYPIEQVIQLEFDRDDFISKHPGTIKFLQREELGCQPIEIETIISALTVTGMPPIEDAAKIIKIFADWFGELPGNARWRFVRHFKDLPIFPTVNGWRKPGDESVFQAYLREEVDEVILPDGFKVSVISRSVYPTERGATSNQFRFFGELGASDFNRRSIIQNKILPVLTNPEMFTQLLSDYPMGIFQAYQFLKEYSESDGATSDFEHRLARVPVPTTYEGSWQLAQKCYFGPAWLAQNGAVLERLFGQISGYFFLDDIPQLEIENEDSRNKWASFFLWLGVADRPNIMRHDNWISRNSDAPLPGLDLWKKYLETHDKDFWCRNEASNHGLSRRIASVSAIEGFSELVREGDSQKLLDLFLLFGSYWEKYYKEAALTMMRCDRQTCLHDQAVAYLLFSLQNASWIPAKRSNSWTHPLSPKHIWQLGETDPVDVRLLVPTLPEELDKPDFREFISALGFVTSGSASIEDFLRLLELMPDSYPVAPVEIPETEHRRWQRSLNAVFNWICERIQTGLVSRGDDVPPLPGHLKVLAYRDDNPAYVPLTSPDLVYPDNPFLAERWKAACAFLRINDDWRKLLGWFGVPNLSDIVRSQWYPDGEMEQETAKLRKVFQETLPYYLSLIKHTQPANYDRLVPRLLRLDISVVKKLSVKEWLEPLPEVGPAEHSTLVHLEKRDEPNPGAGRRFVIAGNLYIAKEAAANPDLLGEYMADYIEIARLGDAFVLLMSRSDDPARWRFLKSKGVSEQILAEVLADIRERDIGGVENKAGLTIEEMLKRITGSETTPVVKPTSVRLPPISTGPDEDAEQDGETTSVEENTEPETRPRYPELDQAKLPGVKTGVVNNVEKPESGIGGRGGSPGPRTGRVPHQGITEELGRRGEQWAYENEKIRLQNEYSLNSDELEKEGVLVWVSRQNPTANHDIKSLDISDTGERRTIYIEVKASTGDARKIKMSRQEFQLAMSLGEDYWLYWISNVDEAKPDPPICYKNIAQLVAEEKIVLDVDALEITLPALILDASGNEVE